MYTPNQLIGSTKETCHILTRYVSFLLSKKLPQHQTTFDILYIYIYIYIYIIVYILYIYIYIYI